MVFYVSGFTSLNHFLLSAQVTQSSYTRHHNMSRKLSIQYRVCNTRIYMSCMVYLLGRYISSTSRDIQELVEHYLGQCYVKLILWHFHWSSSSLWDQVLVVQPLVYFSIWQLVRVKLLSTSHRNIRGYFRAFITFMATPFPSPC